MKKTLKYIRLLIPFIYYLLVFILVALLNIIVNNLYTIFFNSNINYDMFLEEQEFYLLIVNIIIIIIYYRWFKKLKKKENRIIIHKIFNIRNFGLILLLGFGLVFLVTGIMNLLLTFLSRYLPLYVSNYINQSYFIAEGNFYILLISSVIITPIAEELVFRGVILNRSNNLLLFYVANIFQSILFAMVHMNWIMFIYTLPLGLIYGYVYKRYQSIIPTIILHVLNNAVAILIEKYNYSAKEPVNVSITFLISLVCIGVCLLLIYYYFIKREERRDSAKLST